MHSLNWYELPRAAEGLWNASQLQTVPILQKFFAAPRAASRALEKACLLTPHVNFISPEKDADERAVWVETLSEFCDVDLRLPGPERVRFLSDALLWHWVVERLSEFPEDIRRWLKELVGRLDIEEFLAGSGGSEDDEELDELIVDDEEALVDELEGRMGIVEMMYSFDKPPPKDWRDCWSVAFEVLGALFFHNPCQMQDVAKRTYEDQFDREQKALGDNIKRLLKERKMTRRQFGKGAGFPPKTVSRLLNGEIRPQWRTVEKAAKVFGLRAREMYPLPTSAQREAEVEANMVHYLGSSPGVPDVIRWRNMRIAYYRDEVRRRPANENRAVAKSLGDRMRSELALFIRGKPFELPQFATTVAFADKFGKRAEDFFLFTEV